MKRYVNYLAGVGFASIFGFSFLVTKDALEAFSPFELLFLRFALATALMGALALLRLVRLDYRGKDPGPLVLACLFQPILYFASETFGVAKSATSTAGLVLGALPAAVAALGALMLKERLTRLQAASLCLSVAGVGLIVLGGGAAQAGEGSLFGLLCLLGALASAAFFNIYSRRASRVYSPVELTFAMMATGALSFGALALAESLLGGGAAGAAGAAGARAGLLSRATPGAWGAVLYLGALSSVVAFFLVNFSLSRVKASQSAVFSNLTTVISVAAGVAFRGEAFGLPELLGSVLIVLGVFGTNAFGEKALH